MFETGLAVYVAIVAAVLTLVVADRLFEAYNRKKRGL